MDNMLSFIFFRSTLCPLDHAGLLNKVTFQHFPRQCPNSFIIEWQPSIAIKCHHPFRCRWSVLCCINMHTHLYFPICGFLEQVMLNAFCSNHTVINSQFRSSLVMSLERFGNCQYTLVERVMAFLTSRNRSSSICTVKRIKCLQKCRVEE